MKLSRELDYRIRYDVEHDLFHAQNVFNDEYITPTFVEYVQKLEKENAELKKNYEDSLVACGVLKARVDALAQPSPLESMQDVFITTRKAQNEKQREQLTEAKEIIKIMKHLLFDVWGYIAIPLEKRVNNFLKQSNL